MLQLLPRGSCPKCPGRLVVLGHPWYRGAKCFNCGLELATNGHLPTAPKALAS